MTLRALLFFLEKMRRLDFNQSADNYKYPYFFLSSIHIKFPKRIIDRIKYKYKRPKRYDWNSKKENPKNAFIYGDIPRPTHQKKESPPYGLTIYKGYREVVLSRRTVKFILKSNLTKSLLKWSQDITFPEEIFFATLVRINVKKYVHTGIVEQYHTKQAIQYPLCPRRTLWNYATKNCYGQSKRWMCNLRLIETTKLYCKCAFL